MTPTTLRTCCMAGLFLSLGCRGAPGPVELSGVVPSSYRVRMATAPAPDEPPLIAPVVYRKRKQVPPAVRVAFEPERRGLSPLSVPPGLTRRLDPEPLPTRTVEPGPAMSHAPDHRWLVGPLHHDAARGRWTIRYADPGECDPYGGELELLPAGSMRDFVHGQWVRVMGVLVDPEPLQTQPAYRVRQIQPVGPGR